MTLDELQRTPNPLAVHYGRFRVAERLLLTGHSHQAWPDVALEGQMEAWLDAAEHADEKWERAAAKAAYCTTIFAITIWLSCTMNIMMRMKTGNVSTKLKLCTLPCSSPCNFVRREAFHFAPPDVLGPLIDLAMADDTFAEIKTHLSNEHMTDLVLTIAFYCAVVRVLATMKMDNEPQYKEVLKQYPIPGVS